jgi:PAS domain S-box-containing protein
MTEPADIKLRDMPPALTDILIKITGVACSTLELHEILSTIAQFIVDALNKDSCSICLLKPEGKIVCVEAGKDTNREPVAAFCLSVDHNEVVGRLLSELKPLAFEDIREEPLVRVLTKSDSDDLLSLLAVPIIRDNAAAGILMLQSKEPYRYSRDEINIMAVISHNISAAIRNAELYKNVKTQLDELHIIHEIGKALTSILNMDDLLPYICKEVCRLFNAKGCIIRLIEGDNLPIRASFGLPESIKKEMTLRIGEGIAGWVAQTKEPLLVDNVSAGPENQYIPVVEATTVLCVPLKIGEEVIGTLGLYDKKDEWGITTFNERDLNSLKTFASVSSVAIENARLYKTETEKEEKILSLYWDVTQTKDYLKSIIDNSADAIIISDTNGIITSWNKRAEEIYGFTEEEALGKFLPMVPDFLIEDEKKAIGKIMQRETISNIETVRRRKDGETIEISLTLSPVLDSSGKVTGVSGISRDISEKKRLEKELIRRNQELSRLFFINSVIRSTLDLEKLIRMVLTVITMGDGLGFNRAVLFLADEGNLTFKGVMGVGPADAQEAGHIWHELSIKGKTLDKIIEEIESGLFKKDTYLDTVSKNLVIPIDEQCIFFKCATEKKPFNVEDASSNALVNPILIQGLGTKAFGLVPLITRDKAIGIILVDNLITGRPIKDDDLLFLMAFASHIASAIENAKLFESISLAEAELKHIFESISDQVFYTDKDCTIRRINQAVTKRVGKSEGEIIGEKCYKIFHGTDEPLEECPHKKTLDNKQSVIEEFENFHLGGTFVISNSPILDSAGNFIGTVHIARDITELRDLRERVAGAERMAALGELAARVAHEIRNPLISVGGFARRLEKRLTGDTAEYAKIIVNEVTRLEGILKEILGFVKTSSAVKSLTDINELIEDVVNLIAPEIEEKGNRIIKNISKDPVMALVNADKIREAVINLIKNAGQSTENGTIRVSTGMEEDEAVIEIADTGCGISKEDRKNIFNPFFTTKTQGTGLGLAVTHKIIQEHNGRIKLESFTKEDKEADTAAEVGTVFIIYLPSGVPGKGQQIK